MVKWLSIILPDRHMSKDALLDVKQWAELAKSQGYAVKCFARVNVVDLDPKLNFEAKRWSNIDNKLDEQLVDGIPQEQKEFSTWYKRRHSQMGVASAIVWDQKRGHTKKQPGSPFFMLQIVARFRIWLLQGFRGTPPEPSVEAIEQTTETRDPDNLRSMTKAIHMSSEAGLIFFSALAHEDFVTWSECLYRFPELRRTPVYIMHSSKRMREFTLKQSVRNFLEDDVSSVESLLEAADILS